MNKPENKSTFEKWYISEYGKEALFNREGRVDMRYIKAEEAWSAALELSSNEELAENGLMRMPKHNSSEIVV